MNHETAFELLPWLVNGRLAGTERDAVETHVRTCLVCRLELKEQRRLHAAIRSEHNASVPMERAFAALERGLDMPPRHGDADTRLPRQRALAYAVAATFALVVAGFWLTPQKDALVSYTTLTAPSVATGAQIDVVFAEETTAAQIAALLDAIGGEIVAGPSDVGRYGIRLVAGARDGAEIEDSLRRLRADPRVRFAGRAQASAEP